MAVINPRGLCFCVAAFFASAAMGAVLPEDRADLLYHSYDGGGVTISGPSILVRKSFADKVSVSANYYVDKVTGASIDVEATASPYVEERTETSVALDYLHDRTMMSVSYGNSTENDYEANTLSFDISQDFFGDMSTLAFGYSVGDDTVGHNGDPTFSEAIQRRRYRVSFTQVLTRNWIVALNAESIVDEGFLNNPYRSVRYLDGSSYSYQPERYPRTRNTDAFALRSMYYLPYRASVKTELRTFSGSWGIQANNASLNYTHPLGEKWILEGKLRYYEQTQADFYSDLFPFFDAQNFLARDKELSAFSSVNYGIGVTYEIQSPYLSAFNSSTINLFWDHIAFDYDNFRNVLVTDVTPGEEPLYSLDANVLRLFLSFTY